MSNLLRISSINISEHNNYIYNNWQKTARIIKNLIRSISKVFFSEIRTIRNTSNYTTYSR